MLRRSLRRSAPTLEVVRGFRLDQVQQNISNDDLLMSKQEGPTMFSFLAFKGATPLQVAERLLTINESERHVHAIFGRAGVKCDFVLDLDFAHCTQPKGAKGFYTPESVLIESLNAVTEHYTQFLKFPAPTDIVVLDGNSTRKHSYHVHVRSADGVYIDFTALRDVAAKVNAELSVPAVDMGIYRANSTLRVAYTPKFSEPSRILEPIKKVNDPALKAFLSDMRAMSRTDIMIRSLISHPDILPGTKVIRQIGASKGAVTFDEQGNPISKFMRDDKKWMRFGEAVASVHKLPVSAAENYDTWIRVGLALHSFGSDKHIKDHWKSMSVRCRAKYNGAVCDKLWEKFAARPNCYNWRRGYNYLTRTIQSKK